MAMIPLNIIASISKASGELDVWGNPSFEETIEIPANLRSQSGVTKGNNGEDIVYTYTILFEGLVNITQSDFIEFTEANGEAIRTNPTTVKLLRGIDGNVKYTKVVF